MAQGRGNQSAHEDMEWQANTGDGMASSICGKSPREAQMLLSLGLEHQLRSHFNIPLDLKVCETGLQVTIPSNISDFVLAFVGNFQRQITCTPVPCNVANHGALLLPAVKQGLLVALQNAGLAVDIDFDIGKAEILIYAREENAFQTAVQVLKKNLVEKSIPVDDHVMSRLSQDQRWCTFLNSVESHKETCDLTLKLNKTSVIVTGMLDSCHSAESHIKSIIDDICNERENALGSQRMDKATPGDIKIDVSLDHSDAFAYMNEFITSLHGVKLEPFEESDGKGFTLKGQSANVETAEKLLIDFASSVSKQTFTFQDKGYFSTSEGQMFLKEKVNQGCEVLWEKCNRTRTVNDYKHSAESHLPLRNLEDEHQLWTWEIDKNNKIVLAEKKVNEIPTEVIVNIKEMNISSSAKLEWQKQSSVILVDIPVPKCRPAIDFDSVSERFREIFCKLNEDKLKSIAVSVDDTGSWALGTIIPIIIRSYTKFLREESPCKRIKLSLLLCSTVTDTLGKAEKTIQSIVKDELGKQKKNSRDSQKVSVRVTEGSLHEAQADILVNTIHPELDLRKGTVSKALLKGAGKGMQTELYTNCKDFSATDIAITGGYKLKCQYVLHGVLFPFDGEDADAKRFYEKTVNNFVTNCLVKASELRCKSVAFPAVGCGRLQYPIETVASEMFWAVQEFQMDYPDSCVEEVVFVIYPDDTEAVQMFKMEEKNFLERLEKASKENKNKTTLRLVGPKENIDKAAQTISDRLEWLQGKSGETAIAKDAIHGVSEQSYQLLMFFQGDELQELKEDGHKFDYMDEVLTIESHSNDIEFVKTRLRHLLLLNKSQLCKDEVSYDGIAPEVVEQKLKDRNSDVYFIMERKERKVLLFGEYADDVKTAKMQLNAVLKTPVMNKSMRSKVGTTSVNSNVTNSSVISNARTTTQTESSKTVDKKVLVKIDNIPYEQFIMMKYLDINFFHNCNVYYNSNLEQVSIEKKFVADLNKILSEVRKMQSQDIKLPKRPSKKIEPIFESGKVICVFNEIALTITIFAHDMQSVQEKVHQVKVDYGIVERSDRATRQLTASFQIPNSPEEKDQQKQIDGSGARPKQTGRSAPTSTHVQTNVERFFTKENIPVLVYTHNILHLKVDCIVNAANDSLKHGGGIAEVISKAAGRKLDRDCNDFYRRNGPLNVGAVYASVAGKLPYECVIHAVGPRWSDYKPHYQDDVTRCQRDLFMAVLNSFLKAEEKGMTTIAVPAISSAVFKVPKKLCTKMYAAAILAYSKQSTASKTRLSEIHFVDNKTDVIHLIQDEFRRQIPHGSIPDFLQKRSGPPKHPVLAGAQGQSKPDSKTAAYPYPYYDEKSYDNGFRTESICHFSSTLLLIVSTGAMFDSNYASVDGAVCSEDINGRGTGYTAKLLLSKGGAKYKAAKEAAFRRQPSFGDVVCCKGDVTGFKKVLHTVMWKRNEKDSHEQRCEKFRKMFKAVLLAAVKEGCKSIVMPLLFTGQGKVPADFCTDRLLEAFMAFSIENKHSKLTVYLVNDEQRKTDTIKREMLSFLDLQTATRLSKQAHQIPPNPQQRPVSPDVGVRQKPATKLHRSQVDRRQHDRQRDINKMSSTFTSMTVGSGDPKSSAGFSQFYDDKDDDDDDGRDSQGPSWETNDGDNDDVDDVDDDKESQDENCVICMDTVNKPKKLKCGHIFCTDCIDNYFTSYKKVCPTCGVVCGVIKGDQPPGNMDVRFDRNFHCAGFDRVGTHVITYSFNSGTQGPDHPNPGRPYKGITRTAFLPDTREGREVLKMLEVAFDRKLVFTIGSSRTTGQEGVITWNDIHHKTNPKPNTPFGYPDDGYLDRVKDELAVKGVTPEDIQVSYRSK